ncbi:ATP-dependent helicase [candidate division KSB1 bacterium]
MILTSTQQDAIKCTDNNLIVACPGSGKTRTLVAKMLNCIQDVRNSPHKIACLTYTNAAVHEIEYRLRCYGRSGDEDYCDISTIHSFCLINILNFFYELIPEYKSGFTVIPTDCEIYKDNVMQTLDHFKLGSNTYDSLLNLNRQPDGSPCQIPDVADKVVIHFWDTLLSKGLMDFPSIVYYTYQILTDYPSVAHSLASKYKWLLVDEFQDTSALQVEIFRIIAQYEKTKFFLVGDLYQSIFGFAGAFPALLNEFAEEINARDNFSLVGNFRCSTYIVEHAERLCPRSPTMEAVGVNADYGVKPEYVNTDNSFDAITDYFLPALEEQKIPYGEAAILSPWWFKLFPLAKFLREYGIPVVGPGARPYKRTHLFASIAEQICACLVMNSPKIFHQLEKELYLTLNTLSGQRPFTLYSFEGRLLALKILRIGRQIMDDQQSGVAWLTEAATAMGQELSQSHLISVESATILRQSVDDMIGDMKRNNVDIANLTIEDLGLFADTANSIKLLTMHKAKGREFEAVAIIDLHDGKVPDFRALRDNDIDRIEEGRRLLYVGITRAKKYLLYATDLEDYRNKPSRFLGNDGIGIL